MLTRIESPIRYRLVRIGMLVTLFASFAANVAAQRDVSSEAFKESAQLRKREQRVANDIDEYVDRLDKTERALTRLRRTDGDALRKRYQSFSEELKKLEEAETRTIADIDKMKAAGLDSFSSWEKANASITDATLREAAASRRFRMMTRHIELAQTIDRIGLELQPLMSSLRDIRAFLGADPSPANIRTAEERIRNCEVTTKALKSRIAEVQRMFDRLLMETPG